MAALRVSDGLEMIPGGKPTTFEDFAQRFTPASGHMAEAGVIPGDPTPILQAETNWPLSYPW